MSTSINSRTTLNTATADQFRIEPVTGGENAALNTYLSIAAPPRGAVVLATLANKHRQALGPDPDTPPERDGSNVQRREQDA